MFLRLPTELVERLLCYNSAIDVFHCSLACKALRAVYYCSPHLQLIVEAHVAGVNDNPYSELSIPEKLHRLREREKNFGTFSFESRDKIPVTHNASTIYEVESGYYLLGDASNHGKLVTMAINSLPLEKNSLAERWRKINLQKQIIDVGLALDESDLLAVVTIGADSSSTDQAVSISLLQFSTLEKHPNAAISALKVTTTPRYGDRYYMTIEILGNHLALLLHYGLPGVTDLLHVYDWKTGDLLVAKVVKSEYGSLTFLQPGVLILANETHLSLDLLQIPKFPSPPDTLSIIIRLFLPKPKFSTAATCMTIRSAPRPFPATPSPSYFSYAGKQAYKSKPEESLVLLNLSMLDGTFSQRRFSVVFHRRSVIALIPIDLPQALPSTSNYIPTIPWEDWGPQASRWFNSDNVPSSWVVATHGQRYVRPNSNAAMAPAPMKLLDFNPFHIRMVKRQMMAKSGEYTNVPIGTGDLMESHVSKAGKRGSKKLRKAMMRLISSVKKIRRPGSDDHSSLPPSPRKSKGKDTLASKPLYCDELPNASRRLILDDNGDSFTTFGIFVDEVNSYLPYIELTSKETFNHNAVLIDEERLIGLRMGLYSGPNRWVDIMRF